MNLFSSLKDRLSQAFKTNPVSTVLVGLSGIVLVLLLSAFVLVMFCESAQQYIVQILGASEKNEALKFLGIGMGGVILALQALIANKRAKAMEDTANEQAKANEKTEQGQRQERLKNAIEHLGHKSESVRLGGAYELFHLAEDTAQDTKDLRQTVLDILCAHIRQTTGEDEYRKKYKSKPSEEIQSLLTLLFVQKHEVFKGLHINLQGSWLNGADLLGARLEKAVMPGAHLQKALLCGAQLHGANLSEARLHGANLDGARLHRANLEMAHLHWAVLRETELHKARLFLARLYGVALEGAQLYGANLGGAQLHAAALGGARLHEATLMGLELRGATLFRVQAFRVDFGDTPPEGSRSEYWSSGIEFEKHIRRQIAKDSELSQVFFAGGLSQEDVYSAGKGLPDDEARELREELEGHIDSLQAFNCRQIAWPSPEPTLKKKPNNGLPNTTKPCQRFPRRVITNAHPPLADPRRRPPHRLPCAVSAVGRSARPVGGGAGHG